MSVCRLRCRRERRIWRWKGYDRLLGTSLKGTIRKKQMEDVLEDVLYGSKGNLDERIDQRAEFARLACLSLGLDIAGTRQYKTPEVNTMGKLPVIHLLERLLHSSISTNHVFHQANKPYLRLNFHAVPQVNSKLPDVPKRMLVRNGVIHAEHLRCRVLHEVY